MSKKLFSENEYHVPFFDELGYIRKLCPKCREYFWTLIPEAQTCGEATSKGCARYTFINDPPTRRAYNLREMRQAFLSFFGNQNHEILKPYPVVARWRNDLYLTSASIVDFQPYVTNGIVAPPANPLVISQPCIRLVDLNNTGPTFGRHLTIFEMGGHHAFNYPEKEIYWKDATVRYHHKFATKELGIASEEVVYKEDVWSGGGNAGPDLETVVRGLELATLVFMKFKVEDDKFVELPIRTVDTGYGLERYTWISQGAISGFHAIYEAILNKIFEMTGISFIDTELLAKVAMHSGQFDFEKYTSKDYFGKIAKKLGISASELLKTLQPVEHAFAVADHTKSLAFLMAEGVVPSNAQEGYLTRLLIRRTHRLLKDLGIEKRLDEIIDLQIGDWSSDFPHLGDMRDEILEMVAVETEKFRNTMKRGRALVTRIAHDLKSKGKRKIPVETLLELYDSHGVPPEMVQDAAKDIRLEVPDPQNFYKLVTERHTQAPLKEEEITDSRLPQIEDLPETLALYYENPYMTTFESRVLRVVDGNQVVLDRTIFYPEGGGQPADKGYLEFERKKSLVTSVQKVGRVIIHILEDDAPKEGAKVRGHIDWHRRNYLMRAHTATHIVMGAARRVLGQHAWQSGTQKNVNQTRLDISHYKRLTQEEVNKIEALANQAVLAMIPVEAHWLPRDEAEAKYGFRLYQGGAVPGKKVRVVKVGDWEVQACAGTHLRNTSELGYIKILHTERVQDGVERITYSTGCYAVEDGQEKEKLLQELSEILNSPIEKLLLTTKRLLKERKNTRKENRRLIEDIARLESSEEKRKTHTIKDIDGVGLITQEISPINIDRMIKTARNLVDKEDSAVAIIYGKSQTTVRFVVMLGNRAVNRGIRANEIAEATASAVAGGGSGRADFAQGGGTRIDGIPEAIENAEKIIRLQLGAKHNK
ncbi:MAG: alanine--tRNA ligase [Candidatus Bathyarchaeota archaeon]|nr:MAG: alanine--tRNA ligase [Candidatus Bathyarchaeota archaeon]